VLSFAFLKLVICLIDFLIHTPSILFFLVSCLTTQFAKINFGLSEVELYYDGKMFSKNSGMGQQKVMSFNFGVFIYLQ